MFLNNFYRIMAPVKVLGGNYTTKISVTATNGNTYQISSYDISYNTVIEAMQSMIKNQSTYGVVFGTGTTTVKANDYKLSGTAVSTYTGTYTSTFTSDENGVTFSTLYTLTNTSTTNSMTIGEVGLIFNARYTANNSSYSAQCLVERTLLDSPITIAPGGVGQVTYTIRINYPVL